MPFETFTRTLVAQRRAPHLTIQTRGTLTLNAAAFAALGQPEAVELLYDRTRRVLGLRPVTADVPHAMAVRSPSTSTGGPYVVSAMAFLHHYAIDTGKARRWPVRVEDGIAFVDLASPGRCVSKTPPARAATTPPTPEPERRPRPRRAV